MGKPIPQADVHEGFRGKLLTAKQRELRKELKKAGAVSADNSFDKLMKRHEHRCELLRQLGVNVKKTLDYDFKLNVNLP